MRYIYTLPVLFLLLFTLPALAQKRLSEGTISYDIVINTGTDKPQNADFLDGATSAVYVKGNRSRTEMVSPLGTQSTIIDGSRNLIVILKEYGEQRYLISLNPADWKDAIKRYEGVTFTFDEASTKNILGYKCTKAIGKLQDGTTFTVWFTTDLIVENREFDYMNKNLPGLALEYETTLGNLKVTYTVSKISFSPVPAAKFDIPKAGFRVMTYAESRSGR